MIDTEKDLASSRCYDIENKTEHRDRACFFVIISMMEVTALFISFCHHKKGLQTDSHTFSPGSAARLLSTAHNDVMKLRNVSKPAQRFKVIHN
jgi:hypothetical protein